MAVPRQRQTTRATPRQNTTAKRCYMSQTLTDIPRPCTRKMGPKTLSHFKSRGLDHKMDRERERSYRSEEREGGIDLLYDPHGLLLYRICRFVAPRLTREYSLFQRPGQFGLVSSSVDRCIRCGSILLKLTDDGDQ